MAHEHYVQFYLPDGTMTRSFSSEINIPEEGERIHFKPHPDEPIRDATVTSVEHKLRKMRGDNNDWVYATAIQLE